MNLDSRLQDRDEIARRQEDKGKWRAYRKLVDYYNRYQPHQLPSKRTSSISQVISSSQPTLDLDAQEEDDTRGSQACLEDMVIASGEQKLITRQRKFQKLDRTLKLYLGIRRSNQTLDAAPERSLPPRCRCLYRPLNGPCGCGLFITPTEHMRSRVLDEYSDAPLATESRRSIELPAINKSKSPVWLVASSKASLASSVSHVNHQHEESHETINVSSEEGSREKLISREKPRQAQVKTQPKATD